MNERIRWIFSNCQDGLDAIVIMNAEEPLLDVAFPYITCTKAGLFEGCLGVITPDGRSTIITSALEETSARGGKSEVLIYRTRKERDELASGFMKKFRTVGVNGQGITHANYLEIDRLTPNAELLDVSKGLETSRLIKDRDEIDRIRRACGIASRVAEDIPSILRKGMTEHEAAAEIDYRMMKLGASGTAFGTNASFGASSAEPHHGAEDIVLKEGHVALFDFGCKVDGYCSDITRTFFVNEVKDWQEHMYQVVLEAQGAALATIKAGANGKDVDAAARKVIDASEFKGLMVHSTGHGLGLSVHDGGRMALDHDFLLKEGMVLTVEPGVYIAGRGGVRIEDDVLITKDGYEMLTDASKEMKVIT
ncbi:MAG: Xaa-Pro peptidase family protein [Methanomassiliicoccales archaeon]|nr:Xaa-Pro peptidase family protein [Methanomassiliicoccales archaeon]